MHGPCEDCGSSRHSTGNCPKETPASPPPRPSPDRAAWLLHGVSSATRLKIDTFQYEELRGEALALKARVAELEQAIADVRDHFLSAHSSDACVSCALRVKGLSEALGTRADLTPRATGATEPKGDRR